MTREDIIRMARESELMSEYDEASPWVEDHPITEYVERFAALVAAAEREECAKHAEDFLTQGRSPLGRAVGDAIRARGEE